MHTAAIFLPLLGAIIAGVFGRLIGDKAAQWISSGLLVVSAILSCLILADTAFGEQTGPQVIQLFSWISVGGFEADWALRFDTLSAVMVCVVTVVSAVVHVYSVGYMHHDPGIARFFGYLSLFTFAMLMLVTADNFLQMFFGWEGVGVCSYFLIGFWHDRHSANAAAIKAFVVNRVGDFGFLLGIFGVFMLFGSVEFSTVLPGAAEKVGIMLPFLGMQFDALTLVCILLFIGAMGKSAQLLLHTWLPDAMEGPTPVSALIHAATMVTAGVFMVVRLSPMFEYAPDALALVTIVGGATAFFAATIGMVQNDIKRVIAYSTCSQLGYMFFAAGVGAYPMAIFHLMTHAFFKALLFLGSGSVIHGMSDEQDMRKMGGIWKKMKSTYVLMWIGSLALAGIGIPGVFGLAGYYSKDAILESAFAVHTDLGLYVYWLGIAAAFMTAFYSWRLIIMTFHGKSRASKEVQSHVHESPPVMILPLVVLALGAVFAGIVAYPYFVGESWAEFWRGSILILSGEGEHDIMHAFHEVPTWVKLLPLAVGVGGILIAYFAYMAVPSIPGALAKAFRPVYKFLLNKWYFDELYDAIFVKPAFWIGRFFWKKGDGATIDGLGPDGIAARTQDGARIASLLQSGYVYHYAFAILVGVVVIVSIFVFGWLR